MLASILRSDPAAQVVVVRDLHGHAATTLAQRFQQTLPDVIDQVAFVPPLENRDYLSLMQLCDVILDPPHFGGVNTTLDAIALGKPVVTRPTDQHRGRYTSACLRELELEGLIATDLDDYVRIAVELGTQAERRTEVARVIREGSDVVLGNRDACTEHERILHELLSRFR